jgi:hypothetical protein
MKHPDNHEQVVERLVADLKPVTPVSLLSIAAALLVGSIATFLVGTGVLPPRSDLPAVAAQLPFGGSLLCLAALIPLAARYAAASVLPGRYRGGPWATRGMPGVLAFGLVLYSLNFSLPFDGGYPAGRVLADATRCFSLVVLCSLPVALVVLLVSRRAMPLEPRLTAGLGAFTAVLVGSLVMQVHCEVDYALHRIVGHALVGVVAIGVLLSVPKESA